MTTARLRFKILQQKNVEDGQVFVFIDGFKKGRCSNVLEQLGFFPSITGKETPVFHYDLNSKVDRGEW